MFCGFVLRDIPLTTQTVNIFPQYIIAPSSHIKVFLAIGPYCSCAVSVVPSHTNRSSFFVQSIRLTNHYPYVQVSMVYGIAPSVCQTYFPALFYMCFFTTWGFRLLTHPPLADLATRPLFSGCGGI